MKFGTKDMDDAKKRLAAQTERKAGAEGDLEVTTEDLAADEKTKSTLHQDLQSRRISGEAASWPLLTPPIHRPPHLMFEPQLSI